ncbi:sigma-54-dependent Fis family transcriptional regulator [Panacibacter ginsenosidivorans]|uniref:Sigma-54-dependent Fis family transcriptional regulator n=1 Tax=Panacibacter ginsenosidivorans TaxID=1813871 RepID=A0A5B8V645_9BACT|nr:sigma-54 dependent transcriptional regulator [Panacibacter ginsenosidivorans]QEC66323.1 sigma-54-dependent Fis family transcriptional regulator [Panacibacter ginsenosidivorans]
MRTVLIIDDEEKLRSLLARIVKLEGFEVLEAATCKAALKKLEQSAIDAILCDVKLPDGNGVDLVKEVKEKYPAVEIILLTAYGNIPDGVQAIKNGAFDYITKGDDNNKIIPLLHRVFEKIELSERVCKLEKQVEKKYSFDNIIGKSKIILVAVDLAKRVASTDTTVLLTGETGTGKEVFAQAIHQASSRNSRSFVAINCSAFSKELLESEMFGHVAGSFTGASKDKKGLFEEADKGTIFLDEIGEMSIELQAKLLRVIEAGEFIKVGESKTTKVDVRIIAATNRDLHKEIEAGHFRQDLFYRLSVFEIKLPALRDRVPDIEMLAKNFAEIFAAKTNKKIDTLNDAFIKALKKHDWPGNIRELKNVIERSVILANSNELVADTLPFEFQHKTESSTGKILSAFDLASAEKLHIQKVLNYTNGNKTETARLLNIGLTTLYRKIEEYKLF